MNTQPTVYYIGKTFVGYGHYKIYFEFSKNGNYSEKESVKFITTNMQLIDEWNDRGAEELVELYLKYNMQVISENEEIKFDF
jgi:hypothetical protein